MEPIRPLCEVADASWAWGWPAVEAIATAAALVAAGVAVFFAARADSQIRHDATQERERRRAEQASQVGAWLEDRYLFVKNASELPVFSVRMWLVPADAEPLRLPNRGVLAPGNDRALLGATVRASLQIWVTSRPRQDRPPIPCVMTFRDSQNQWWIRDVTGVLRPITEAEKRPYSTGEAASPG